MDSMNFLNKKYVNAHAQSLSQSRSSRAFVSSHTPHYSQNIVALATMQPTPHSPSSHGNSNLISNHCTVHPQELIRHICLDCIELLCA